MVEEEATGEEDKEERQERKGERRCVPMEQRAVEEMGMDNKRRDGD